MPTILIEAKTSVFSDIMGSQQSTPDLICALLSTLDLYQCVIDFVYEKDEFSVALTPPH